MTADEVLRTRTTLSIKTILNGQTMQDSNTDDMIFDVPSVVSFLSGSTTLLAGTTVILDRNPGARRRHGPQAAQVWLAG